MKNYAREYCGAANPNSRTANCVLSPGHEPIPHRSVSGDRWTTAGTDNRAEQEDN